jgi:hypothetical protein
VLGIYDITSGVELYKNGFTKITKYFAIKKHLCIVLNGTPTLLAARSFSSPFPQYQSPMLYFTEELSLPLLKSLNSESASFSLQYRGCTSRRENRGWPVMLCHVLLCVTFCRVLLGKEVPRGHEP